VGLTLATGVHPNCGLMIELRECQRESSLSFKRQNIHGILFFRYRWHMSLQILHCIYYLDNFYILLPEPEVVSPIRRSSPTSWLLCFSWNIDSFGFAASSASCNRVHSYDHTSFMLHFPYKRVFVRFAPQLIENRCLRSEVMPNPLFATTVGFSGFWDSIGLAIAWFKPLS